MLIRKRSNFRDRANRTRKRNRFWQRRRHLSPDASSSERSSNRNSPGPRTSLSISSFFRRRRFTVIFKLRLFELKRHNEKTDSGQRGSNSFPENNNSSASLKHTGYLHFLGLPDKRLPIAHHNHRSIVEVAHPLTLVSTFPHHFESDYFPGKRTFSWLPLSPPNEGMKYHEVHKYGQIIVAGDQLCSRRPS